MNGRLLSAVLAAGLFGLVLGGCATAPGQGSGAQYDPDKPQIFIPSAKVEHVKGVAMGSAKSKGWTFVETTDDTLIMQRPLNSAAAESIEPGAGLGPQPAMVEIRSTFFPRLGGVDVLLDAQVLVHRGTDAEKRIDYTEEYRTELKRSLVSLQAAWNDSRTRVASALPPLGTHATLDEDAGVTPGDDTAPTEGAGDQATPPEEAVASAETGPPSAWGRTAAPEQLEPAPVISSTAAMGAAPVAERMLSAEPAPAIESNSMLVLRQPRETGIWAYYAEQYARLRGCSITDEGAVLEEKAQAYEVYRVPCSAGNDFQVKCNAGSCRGMR